MRLEYENFRAWVSCDGVSIPVYSVDTIEEEGTKIMTCWIASQSGKRFEVHWRNLDPIYSSSGMYIDHLRIKT
jgi:hypothetical protein